MFLISRLQQKPNSRPTLSTRPVVDKLLKSVSIILHETTARPTGGRGLMTSRRPRSNDSLLLSYLESIHCNNWPFCGLDGCDSDLWLFWEDGNAYHPSYHAASVPVRLSHHSSYTTEQKINKKMFNKNSKCKMCVHLISTNTRKPS